MKTLIIGIGNEFRCDDAAGVLVAKELEKLNLNNVKITQCSGEGAQLIELWKKKASVIIIDAAQKQNQTGKITHLKPLKNQLEKNFFNYSSHLFSLAEAIEMSKILKTLPKKIEIYAIEGENFAIGREISPNVSRAIKKCTRLIKKKFNELFKFNIFSICNNLMKFFATRNLYNNFLSRYEKADLEACV